MSFYIRKSIRLGPIRLNLSKSGVGASIGIKGLRVGTGPRGNYIHAGQNGFFYRASLPSGKPWFAERDQPSSIERPQALQLGTHDPLKEIESGSVLQMTDSSSAGLLQEINSKRKLLRLWPFVAALSMLCIIISGGTLNPLFLICAIIATIGSYYYDQLRKTVVLFYDFEPNKEAVFKDLHDSFHAMMRCNGSWHVDARGAVRDRKYHAGASSLIRRNHIRLSLGQPPFVKTNIDVPTIPVGKQTLYFFPDRLLIFENAKVGAVSYSDLRINVTPSRFIEDGNVPVDAEVIDRTWRYVNKKGGPDRRFRDNRQLPIVLYEESHFQSNTGLNEVINLSKRGTTALFSQTISRMAL